MLICLSVRIAGAQTSSNPALPPIAASAPYLQRGDEVERRYGAYRKRLEIFFDTLRKRLADDAPELLSSIEPPAPVPYGYQIVPTLVSDPTGPARRSGLILSPFSWSRVESSVERDERRLDSLTARFSDLAHAKLGERRPDYGAVAADYKKLVASQKLIANQTQYNRFWQGDIATHPVWYLKLKRLQDAALERQLLHDVLWFGDDHFEPSLRRRSDSLARQIEDWLKKLPTPDFVRVDHPGTQQWVLRVPVYTDIEDSAFVEGFREAIESGWRVHDGNEDFSVKLDIRRLSPSALWPDGRVPEKGAHIDLDAHAAHFPEDGVVLITGGNSVRALARAIILSPFAIRKSTLVHEFGHMLGFKDGYFRSYEDRGPDGYEVLEVILDPHDVVAAPEGLVRREHFEQILREKTAQLPVSRTR